MVNPKSLNPFSASIYFGRSQAVKAITLPPVFGNVQKAKLPHSENTVPYFHPSPPEISKPAVQVIRTTSTTRPSKRSLVGVTSIMVSALALFIILNRPSAGRSTIIEDIKNLNKKRLAGWGVGGFSLLALSLRQIHNKWQEASAKTALKWYQELDADQKTKYKKYFVQSTKYKQRYGSVLQQKLMAVKIDNRKITRREIGAITALIKEKTFEDAIDYMKQHYQSIPKLRQLGCRKGIADNVDVPFLLDDALQPWNIEENATFFDKETKERIHWKYLDEDVKSSFKKWLSKKHDFWKDSLLDCSSKIGTDQYSSENLKFYRDLLFNPSILFHEKTIPEFGIGTRGGFTGLELPTSPPKTKEEWIKVFEYISYLLDNIPLGSKNIAQDYKDKFSEKLFNDKVLSEEAETYIKQLLHVAYSASAETDRAKSISLLKDEIKQIAKNKLNPFGEKFDPSLSSARHSTRKPSSGKTKESNSSNMNNSGKKPKS